MTTMEVTVVVKDGRKRYTETRVFTIDELRTTPNPRQAVVARFLYMAREVLTNVRPHFTL